MQTLSMMKYKTHNTRSRMLCKQPQPRPFRSAKLSKEDGHGTRRDHFQTRGAAQQNLARSMITSVVGYLG